MNGTWEITSSDDYRFYPHKMVYKDEKYYCTEYMKGVKPRHIRRAKRDIKRRVRRYHATAEAIRAFNEAKEH